MSSGKANWIYSALFLFILVSCSGSAVIKSSKYTNQVHGLIQTPYEFIDHTSDKLWEGEIRGKWVSYFRMKEESNYRIVVVVTHDMLPASFRSVEYCDDNGDENLDRLNIKLYQQGQGWRDVLISEKNTITINQANNQYNELLGKIRHRTALSPDR